MNAIGEALTNLVWAPLEKGLASVSLSANWMALATILVKMHACMMLFRVVQISIALGINIPTGKDSYP